MTPKPDEPTKIELKSNRIITAQVIRDLAEVLTIILKTTPIDNLSYLRLAQELMSNPKFAHINTGTLKNTFERIFPKNKLKSKKTPNEIAKEFLDQNPKYLIPEKLAKATELYKPGISVKALADAVGLDPQTVREYLKKASVPNLTSAQKGINQKQMRGQPEKENYRYFAYPKVLLVAEALTKHNRDKEKAYQELIGRFKETQIKDLLQSVFPAHLLEKGIDYCVDRYKAWLDAKPISQARFNEEQKARKEILFIIKNAVNKDTTIKHKLLFLRIAFECLMGKKLSEIAIQYQLDELTIKAIRNKVQRYFLEHESEYAVDLEPILRKTRFFDGFEKEKPFIDPKKRIEILKKLNAALKNNLKKQTPITWPNFQTLVRRKTKPI